MDIDMDTLSSVIDKISTIGVLVVWLYYERKERLRAAIDYREFRKTCLDNLSDSITALSNRLTVHLDSHQITSQQNRPDK